MSELLVDEIEDDVLERLQKRADSHGRSTKEEAREILRNAVKNEGNPPVGLGTRLAAIFHGDEEVRETPREAVKNEGVEPIGLGSRIAARFRDIGLTEEIPELRGYPAEPIEFDW